MKRIALAIIIVVFGISANAQPASGVLISTTALSAEIAQIITEYYYKDVNAADFADKLINGNADAIDSRSDYFSPLEFERHSNRTNGVICGIGVKLKMKTENSKKYIVIQSVYADGPAAKAGLRQDDYIITVASDGIKAHAVTLVNGSFRKAGRLIQGTKGTTVYLRVRRGGQEINFLIIRDEFEVELLENEFIAPHIGYLRLYAFGGEKTLGNFALAISSMQKNGMQVLILDLRDNPGGQLDYAIAISRFFKTMNGAIVTMKERHGEESPRGSMLGLLASGIFSKLPVILLVNENSASASEIVAAYLKNYRNVPVVGTKTYGKGTVQRFFQLSNGAFVKLTVAEYFVGPDKTKVDGLGITPTIEVKNPKNVTNEKQDAQLQRAILEAMKLVK